MIAQFLDQHPAVQFFVVLGAAGLMRTWWRDHTRAPDTEPGDLLPRAEVVKR